MIEIRSYRVEDEDSIIKICYETRDESLKDLENKKILALRWALPYTRFFKEFCFVATENDIVIGYIIGTPDTLIQEKFHIERIVPEIKSTIHKSDPLYETFTSFIPINQMVPGLAEVYPAHLHINLTSKCRNRGIGSKLINTLENKLKGAGVTGLHLGVMKENFKAVNFYRKHGFSLYKEYEFGDNDIGYFMVKKL